MNDLTDRIARLSPEKWRLLESRLRKKITASADQTIPRRAKCEAIPLSFAQQRLWFLDQFEPGSTFYNISSAKRLKGTLNLEALQKTLDTIVARHEVLRTTFAAVDGVPEQVIAENRSLELEVRDLSTCSASDREAEVQRLLKEETGRPFNLSSDLMLRASLLKLEEQENILLLVMHHIASDGWSMRVLFRELTTLYEAFSTGKPSSLAELSIQYADYAIWQRQWLQGEVLRNQLSYWKKQLSGIPVLQLPTDRPRPPVQTYRGVQESLVLSRDLSNELKLLSRKERVTLFMTLLAAFQGLLHRYTGQEDIGVGSPIANRTRHEIQGLIGFFVNMLVLRTDLSGSPTFRELMGRVRKVALGAYEHQDLPFEKLVELLNPERNLSHAPLFQVMFAFENVSKSTLELPGLALSSVEVNRGTAMFDLILTVTETADSLTVSLEYSPDLFEATTISRMLGHFQILLQGIAANPDQRLSDLPILTEAERHQLLVEWNDTRRDHPKDKCIHEFFETQVTRTPDDIAVICEDQQIAYRELNGRANQLARHLKKLGVGPEIKVGLCVERSLEMVVGLLGILKAGGAYVPLTPEYPQDRLVFMLKDSQAPVLLTQRRLVERLSGHNVQSVCLDTEWDAIAEESRENLVSEATGDNSAFVVYTSGSTGAPKGVIVSHGNLVNAYLAWEQAYSLSAVGSCHLQMANFSFDVFSGDLVRALCSGAKLFLCPHELLSMPRKLYEVMRREGVDWAEFVPVVLRHLLQYLRDTGQNLHFMRLLAVGSDAWHMQEHREVRLLCGPETRLIHSYGVTEATVDSSYFDTIDEVDLAAGRLVPIGRPFTNTEIYILDRSLQPVPIGVPGELYIGGAGLARGYLNRPELTAEKFIPNPFSVKPGERLYKTGDSARYMPDGNVEFLGRVDYQVKIRGFRIEPGEIEGVLSQHPAVRETTVLAREDVSAGKRLVAYVVASGVHSPTTSELRAFLQQKLPGYMIPSQFVFLESLPLTPNGKIDRSVLPLPDKTTPDAKATFVAPRTPLEETLTRIWGEILRLEQVGIHDNFFDLGGHSLLGTKLIAQIQKDFQIDLPLRFLFESPTIAGLAARIPPKQDRDSHRQEDKETYSYLVELQSGAGKKPVFFFPGGGGSEPEFFIYARLARYVGPDYRFYGLRARGADGVSQPHGSVEEMAADYIKEIQTLQPQGPYFLVGECIGGVVAYEAARQLEAMGQKVAVLALMDTKLLTTSEYLRLRMDKFLERKSTSWEENPIWARIIFHSKQLRQLDSRQRVHYVFDKARRAVPAVLVEILPKILPRQETNMNGSNGKRQLSAHLKRARTAYMRSLRRYKPRPYGDRIHILVSEKLHGRDPTLGWDKLALKGLDIHKLPGDHLAYIREHVETTARQLRECLDQGTS